MSAVREQIGDVLIVDVLPPQSVVRFITVDVNIDPPTRPEL